MSRGSKSRSSLSGRRGISIPTANPWLPRQSWLSLSPFDGPLTSFEDRRSYHPEGDFRPARGFRLFRHRVNVPSRARFSPQKFLSPSATVFNAPQEVLVCVRRSVRREVLHALGRTGKVGQGRPHRNWLSSVSCRRR